ncbi:MAG: STT3 domain-containing protein, partial [bacterium]|nr:STT3 domain-containing protein [bacterium]
MNKKIIDFVFFLLCILINLHVRCLPSDVFRGDYEDVTDKKRGYLLESYSDESGDRYFSDVDSYQYLLRTKNVLDNGFPGDIKKDGAAYDCFTLAPLGNKVSNAQLLFYLSSFFFKIYSFFGCNMSIQNFLFLIPVFYSLLFVAVVYFAARAFYSPIGAFLTGFCVGLNEMLVVRTSAGWYDHDSLNLTLPFAVVWFFWLSLKHRNNALKSLLFVSAAAVSIGLFAFSWSGWWFALLIVVFCGFFLILNNMFIAWKNC